MPRRNGWVVVWIPFFSIGFLSPELDSVRSSVHCISMYIRRTLTRSLPTGEHYYSHRLVRSERVGGRVRQVTLLNLGQHFVLSPDLWQTLCGRIEEILAGRVVSTGPGGDQVVEREAQRLAALLLAREARSRPHGEDGALASVDVASLDLMRAQSVGVEHVALWAIGRLGLSDQLRRLGMPERQVAAATVMVVARLAAPGTAPGALATWGERSAIGELLGIDVAVLTPWVLFRVEDSLLRYRSALESHLFTRLLECVQEPAAEPIYDLSQTCRGEALRRATKDWPQHPTDLGPDGPGATTLGLVLDQSGFIHRSLSFHRQVVDGSSLGTMLDRLGAPVGALVAIDRSMADAVNLAWLRAHGYRYLVVAGARVPALCRDCSTRVQTVHGTLELYRVASTDGPEVFLYSHVPDLQAKEDARVARRTLRLEAGLARLAAGLATPGGDRGLDLLNARILRLQERSGAIGRHYRITLTTDASGADAVGLSWERQASAADPRVRAAVYCLRSSENDWDAQQLFRAYRALTERAAVFSSLTPVLGAPWAERRGETCSAADLFVSVLAYQVVQVIRHHLMLKGRDLSWQALRETLAGQCRVTASIRHGDGRTLHIRKATRADPDQLAIYEALGIDPAPGGVQETLI